MFRLTRSPAFQRQLAARGIATSRTLLMALQTTKAPPTSLNAAAMTHLDLNGTLEEVASRRFSESSAFPEFSPMEDTLLSEAVPRIKYDTTMTSLNCAAKNAQLELNGTLEEVAATHFSEASAFPEFSPMEDTLLGQAMPHIPNKVDVMDAHDYAEGELMAEMQLHFCESSDFPEYSPAEEEAMMLKAM